MTIRIPGDPKRAAEALRDRRERQRAEEERLRLEVEGAVATYDVVRMATLWFERRDGLTGEMSEHCVRDMNRLTPELAHAANDEGLPYHAMLVVRRLAGSAWLFQQAPMLQMLAGAALEVEALRFRCEAKQRRAQRRSEPVTTGITANEVPPPKGSGEEAVREAPAIADSTLLTIQDIEIQTDIPYSTLTSRRHRLQKGRPEPVGKDRQHRDLYRRGDWNNIIAAIRGNEGGTANA